MRAAWGVAMLASAVLTYAAVAGASGVSASHRPSRAQLPPTPPFVPGGNRPPVYNIAPSTLPCPVSSNAFVTESRHGTFVTETSGVLGVAPWKGLPNGAEPLWVQDYVVGRIHAYLTTLALHGKWRADLNRRARRLGYPIRKLPLVPLEGLIVKDNPNRLLEYSETVFVFTSPAGAADWMSSIFAPGSQATTQGRVLRLLPQLGDETQGYARVLGPASALPEHAIVIFTTLGSVGVWITYQGGRDVSLPGAINLERLAVDRIKSECPRL